MQNTRANYEYWCPGNEIIEITMTLDVKMVINEMTKLSILFIKKKDVDYHSLHFIQISIVIMQAKYSIPTC